MRSWLSPPDPSKNHNIAHGAQHGGTAEWFIQGSTFENWYTTGSLLWIHGKRMSFFAFRSIAFFDAFRPCEHVAGSGKTILWYVSPQVWIFGVFMLPTSSTIIQEIKTKCGRGLALMGYYYFDFKDITKQGIHGLLASLLSQFCATSDPCYEILSDLYSENHEGSQQPSNEELIECLKKILRLPDAPMRCIIMDAIDECPNTSECPTAREEILDLLEELVGLSLPNLRICVTSRPEIDIQTVLKPLTPFHMSLHDQSGQKQDILDYIKNFVLSDRRMRKWRREDKQTAIDTLSAKADGMWVTSTAMSSHSRLPKMQVSMGVLPTRNLASLSTKCYWACSGRVARVVGRNIRADFTQDPEGETRICPQIVPVPHSCRSTTSCR
jgi:hypothetical protein